MRRSSLKPSRGTVWPPDVARAIEERDGYRCVGPRVGMPGVCEGPPEKDHVRASGAVGLKSRSTLDNGVLLCSNTHHPLKTREGRTWRPVLIDYLASVADPHAACIDPCPSCPARVMA